MKKSLFLFVCTFSLVNASSASVIRRTFSCSPTVDELKQALMASDWKKIKELMPTQFPRNIHAQYAYLGLSDNQLVRNCILNAIFVEWSRLVFENPLEALGLIRLGLASLYRDYGIDLDKGFLEILSRLQIALLMCPAISETPQYRQEVLKIAPSKNIFITAFTYANQTQQAQEMRGRKAYAIARSRPIITTPWPLN